MNRTKTHEDYIGITPVPYFKLLQMRQVKFQGIAISKAVLKCSIKFISSTFKYSFLSTDHTNFICYTIMKIISFSAKKSVGGQFPFISLLQTIHKIEHDNDVNNLFLHPTN